VLAIQSGGLALNSSNNIAGLIQECVADAAPYYEISFDSSRLTDRMNTITWKSKSQSPA